MFNKFKWLLFTFSVLLSACSQPDVELKNVSQLGSEVKTYAKFVPERADDFAWENDLVAFRAYGPALRESAENSGVDCWLKRVDYSIINKWYHLALNENKSYHQDRGEGLDNYHVGSSAGCGSTAMWINETREPLETFTDWQIIKSSKQQTQFVLNYERTIDGNVYKEKKLITINLGSRLYSVESTFWINGNLATETPIALGLTTHDGKAKPLWDLEKGYLLAWEKLGEHGLGTAVIVSPNNIQTAKIIESFGQKDKGHALLIVNTDSKGKIYYKSGYGWQGEEKINTVKDWINYLNGHLYDY